MDEWRRDVSTASARTHYLELGQGDPVVLLHGSGPGVSALANWRFTMPVLARDRRAIAPDLLGFGRTETSRPARVDLGAWVDQVVELADALGMETFDVVGNSMGGAIALALAVRHPARVRRLVTMGTLGVPVAITPALDAVWGYRPDLGEMRRIIGLFAWDQRYAQDEDLVRLRYETSLEPSVRGPYEAMFPAPRQAAVDAAVVPEADLRALPHPALLVHGQADRVVPLETSLALSGLLPNARLAIFPRCGHWVQIERRVEFPELVAAFLRMPLDDTPVGEAEGADPGN
jgi:2-hydroxymuconate-semialdehyde hydrolase